MVNVKIECGCGQHYAFDVQPVDGRMASIVNCPTCGADGTELANEIIAGQLAEESSPPAQPEPMSPPATGGARLKISAQHEASPAAPGIRVDSRTLGLVDPEAAKAEARAKISWGDAPEAVINYLMLQGFGALEARELVNGFYKERLRALRGKGVKKIFMGIGMVIGAFIILLSGVLRISIFLAGGTFLVGVMGLWFILNGIITFIAPKTESGDVAEG